MRPRRTSESRNQSTRAPDLWRYFCFNERELVSPPGILPGLRQAGDVACGTDRYYILNARYNPCHTGDMHNPDTTFATSYGDLRREPVPPPEAADDPAPEPKSD